MSEEMPASGGSVTGTLDSVSPDGVLDGWCFAPAEPDSRRQLAVEIDGRPVAVVVADQPRHDLRAAGMGDGAHAFRFGLAPDLMLGSGPCVVAIRDVATGRQIGQGIPVTWRPPPATAPAPAAALVGNLDRVTRDGSVSGWCWYPDAPSRRVDLAVFVDDEQVGETRAARFRVDLERAGIGDGAHGFLFALPWAVLAQKGSLTVSVREHPGGVVLGKPMTLRFGRLAATEERIEDLERQVRILRATLAEARRDRQATDEGRAARELFRTVGTFFQRLADNQGDMAEATGLRDAVAEMFQRFAPIALARPADPAATICLDADAPMELLHGCLDALRDAGADRLADIVLADDGRHGAAAALLPSIVTNLGYARNAGPGGRLAARNAVAHGARGAIVVFLAAGARPTREWLPTLLATLADEPEAALVSSPIVREDGTFQHFGLSTERSGADLSWRDPGLSDDATRPSLAFMREVGAVADYAFAIRLTAFTGAGGFDAGFEGPAAATFDLCLRLRRLGGLVLAQPKAALVWPEAVSALAPELAVARGAPDPGEASEDVARIRQRFRSAGEVPPVVVGRALVVDTSLPRPDRDAGSVAVLEQMRLLRRLGYRVTFKAVRDPEAGERRWIDRLEREGIEVAREPETRSVTALLEAAGPEFDVVLLNRHINATLLLGRVRELAPAARVVFCPSDLHFLRERRGRALNGEDEPGHDTTRAAELAAIAGTDATIVFSDAERDVLRDEVDAAKPRLLRWIARPVAHPAPFAARSGVCFVGNFAHPPNVDGILWFVREVMPLIAEARPGLRCHVAGDGAPQAVLALASDSVILHGWVEDLDALLSSARVGIAPLRYGAGFKGKVAASLACGTPVVGTAIALEGTGLSEGDGVRLADGAEAFAEAVLSLDADAAAWSRLSARAIERCGALYSPEAGLVTYAALLASLGLPRR